MVVQFSPHSKKVISLNPTGDLFVWHVLCVSVTSELSRAGVMRALLQKKKTMTPFSEILHTIYSTTLGGLF